MEESRAGTLLHEMAHMWFGDLVTQQWWDDLWLSESFADFCEYHARGRLGRFSDAWSAFSVNEKVRGFADDQLPSAHPVACSGSWPGRDRGHLGQQRRSEAGATRHAAVPLPCRLTGISDHDRGVPDRYAPRPRPGPDAPRSPGRRPTSAELTRPHRAELTRPRALI